MPKIFEIGGIKTHNLAIIIPREIVKMQKIRAGTTFDVHADGYDRIILDRMLEMRTPPDGSIWMVVKG